VAKVQGLGGRSEDRVVPPRCEPVLSCVERPGRPKGRLADETAEARIRQDVAPRRRGGGAGPDADHVLAPVRGESTCRVVEDRRGSRRCDGAPLVREGRFEERQLRWLLDAPVHPEPEGSVPRIEQDASARFEVSLLVALELIGREHEDAPVPIEPFFYVALREDAPERPRSLGDIRRGPLVDEDEVEADAARSEVALRGDRLS